MTKKITTGGCQCGAVRYRVSGELKGPHICYCRMCQKAAGNYFMPLAHVARENLEITRGEPSWFFSSEPVRRGFCNKCGTPLLFDDTDDDSIHIILGSLDDPSAVEPTRQYGLEGKVDWFGNMDTAPGTVTEEDDGWDEGKLDTIRDTSRQHPDHDTDHWPETEK